MSKMFVAYLVPRGADILALEEDGIGFIAAADSETSARQDLLDHFRREMLEGGSNPDEELKHYAIFCHRAN